MLFSLQELSVYGTGLEGQQWGSQGMVMAERTGSDTPL
jgi:hypothetical protein